MATVTRGKTWLTGDVLNVSTMNDAALPTVVVADNEVTTAKINDGAVTNAKIASGVDAAKLTTGTLPVARLAAGSVTLDKLENVTAGRVVLGNASNVPTGTAVSGDVTITSSGVTSIGSAKVTAAKLDGVAKDNAGSNLTVGTTPVFGCRAFVNFDGLDANATTVDGERRCNIRASGNVSKVVRTDAGKYTITFSPALPDGNYSITATCSGRGTNSARQIVAVETSSVNGPASNKTGSAVSIYVGDSDTTGFKDNAEINVIIIR